MRYEDIKKAPLRPVETRKHTPEKTERARMSSLRRLARQKVCLRRRALTSHTLCLFRCCAVLSEMFFVQAK